MADQNPAVQAQGVAAATQEQANDFLSQLNKAVGAKSDEKQSVVRNAVAELCGGILKNTQLISDNALQSIESYIAEIDRVLSTQLNQIMHHEEFTKLEGTWRGLHFLVNNTETDEMLRIKVMNISKTDLSKTLKRFEGSAFDQSPLFKKIYRDEYGTPGGVPFGALIGDYAFDHNAADVKMLGSMAGIAAAAHCPFIAGAAPTLLNMESWQELSDPPDLKLILSTPEYAAWRSLRESEDSRFVGLAMPRFLSRLPYNAKSNPSEGFDFEEEAEGHDPSKYVWSNSAYAMGANITRSFKYFGWCACIRGLESGGVVEGLPIHTFPTSDGSVDVKCPTEIAIDDRREKELADCGLMPLSFWKGTDYAAFVGAQSLQKPAKYDDAAASANAQLSARLQYIFCSCRFAHYLKIMVREKIGSFMEREDMENWLHRWISNYVTPDPKASQETKASHPLSEAAVKVVEVEGNPGYYNAVFHMRPHYQLEGLTTSLRLVAQLKGGN